MKNKLLAIALITCMLFGLVGCQLKDKNTVEGAEDDGSRMVLISREYDGDIIFDRDTGVQYWRSNGAYSYGHLTMLVDANGDPLIYEGWKVYKNE